MKTLANHLILFDAECPMCRLYTNAFIGANMLDEDGRAAYQTLQAEACPMVDRQRAVNEIALVNKTTGEVTYGVHSLFKVIGNALPVLKPLFNFRPFAFLMIKVYSFISYNRRVIIPTAGDGFALQPTFKLHYRVAYLIFTWAITSLILTYYAPLLGGIMPVGGLYREALICGGQIFFQGMVISFADPKKRWEYLGNMMTISFAGGLLLLPVVMISGLTGNHPVMYASYFMLVAGLMFLEHIRRSKLLAIGWLPTISWAFYRALILIVILYLETINHAV
ncbi:DUF393 domain-containing protein [Mucilaginibacter pallidiroseus]|uniref:DUF393 domain-containing protein n=1 Tax=Mucilaginibacter pallidiroseus TaxID=2599295 RepID=A0A563UG01_9SPHI|nr:DUF393 domain-containing protein [Mucilaginibacter pallidiroseus]TWR30288.1 DUF393 domain-containing protein [Mucilaginibacter pallidiroseus]